MVERLEPLRNSGTPQGFREAVSAAMTRTSSFRTIANSDPAKSGELPRVQIELITVGTVLSDRPAEFVNLRTFNCTHDVD